MLDILLFKFGLWKLQNDKEKIRKYYKKQINKARKENKSRDEIERVIGDHIANNDFIDDDIAETQHRLLERQAEKYLIPTPKRITKDGTWKQSEITGQWRLSQEAISKLKDTIRQERKDRREYWQSWLALLTGFIGTLIGLLSVL